MSAQIPLALAILFLTAKTVAACVCPNTDNTVLGKFEDSRFVVIAKVIAVETVSQAETTKMVIEKVYKGNLRVGEEMIFRHGEHGSCFEDFDDDDIGTKFLLYLKPKKKTENAWYAEVCGGRSKPLPGLTTKEIEDATDDLSYLDNMDQLKGKTRISGTLISYQWSPSHGGADFKKIPGRKVRLIGEKGIYETETNENGVYEIYDLPPGRYKVEPNIPKGWAIDHLSAWGGGASSGIEDSKHFQLTLKKGRHAHFDFFFKTDSKLHGRVLNSFGNPMKSVCVNLVPTEGKVSEYFKKATCTNNDGSFEIDEIPFGSYFLIVNDDDRISSYEPFRRFYYPEVHERAQARIVNFVEGEALEAIDIRISEMKEVVTLEGVFVTSDGKPVTQARIYFEAEKTDELTYGNANTLTDENGKFSLRVLKGLKGRLFGEMTLDVSDFKDCPQVIALLRKSGKNNWLDQKTDAVEIQIQGNVDNLEFKLPFPSCKGAKVTSQIKID